MPLVRVDVPHGYSTESKLKLREAIKGAINTALDPKVTKYIYVSVRDVYAEIGDGAPTVSIDLRPGREVERKQALAQGIAGAFTDVLDIDPKEIYLMFREAPASEHYCGGEPLPDWRPE